MERILMKYYLIFSLFIFALSSNTGAWTIKHKFIAVDESRDSLVFIDENNPAANWAVKIDKSRDMQLVGRNRVMLSNTAGNGFTEYDLSTRQKVRDIKPQGLWSVQSCRRLPNGLTLVVGEGINIWTIDSTGAKLKTVNIPGMSTFRCMRMTAQSTYLLGSGGELVEADTNGAIIKRQAIANANSMYQAMRLSNGNIILSGGYGKFIDILNSSWQVIKTIGVNEPAGGYQYNFFAGFQVLKSGNIVMTNWLGHGYNDGANGIGLIEFDTSGTIVWSWMDHARVSSLHAVIILDSLNTALLHDDRNGIMAPVEGQVGVRPENRRQTESPAIRPLDLNSRRLFDIRGAALSCTAGPDFAAGNCVSLTSGKVMRIVQ